MRTALACIVCLVTLCLGLPSMSNYPKEDWLLPRYGKHPEIFAVADNIHNDRRVVEAPEPASFTGDLTSTSGEIFPYNNIRLPSTVLPISYSLHMYPNLTDFTFKGSASIEIKAFANTDFIVYHRAGLVMLREPELETSGCGSVDLPILKSLENLKHEQGYLKLAEPLKAGQRYKMKFTFRGLLTRNLKGFYRSRYYDNGKEKWFALTDFEATDARRAFPCFDEPAMKATFQVTMARDSQHTSLSNTPIEHTKKLSRGLYSDKFQRTLKMSTYLVAFIVSDFAKLEAKTTTGIKVAAHAPTSQICQAQLALDVAVVILEYYEKFFGIPFPLPKMDIISVKDFSAGAMENWGLVTFAENSFLYDAETSSSYTRQRVAVVVAHEFAHQWFGNLVTMKWWNDIWLNEGFASFVEYIGTDKWDKDWKMLDQFIPETLLGALRRDAYSDSHPISVDVKDPGEIRSLFDTISYNKGASIIRMLQSFMGKDTLTAGLKTYLNKYKYSNAVTNDLWDVLTETLKKDKKDINVRRVMNTWTNQMGYPLITMNVRHDGVVITTQSRYILDAENPKKTKFVSPYGYHWNVPLTYKSDKGPDGISWMKMYGNWFKVPAGSKWVKANIDMLGYYRVQYNIENWNALAKQLSTDYRVFSASDRANLLTDSFEFTRTAHLNVTVSLELTKYLPDEVEFVPWSMAIDIFASIGTHVQGLKRTSRLFRYYANDCMDSILDTLVWDNTATHMQRKLRSLLLRYAIIYQHPATVAKAKKLYTMYKKTGNAPASDVFYWSLRVGVEGDNTGVEFDFIMKKFYATSSFSLKRTLMAAAATTTDDKLRLRLLTESLSKMRSNHGAYALYYVAGASEAGRRFALQFLMDNWTHYSTVYGKSSYYMYWIMATTTWDISIQCELDELQEFFSKRDNGGPLGKGALEESVHHIKENILWRKRNQKDVAMWLSAYFRA